MVEIEKVEVYSIAKPFTVGMSFFGLVVGIVYSVGGLIVDVSTVGLNEGTLLAFLSLLGMPLIFAVCGFVLGVVGALLNNVVVKILQRTRRTS